MGRLSEQLASHVIIGLDTAIFIYHLEAHPRYLPLTQELLAGVQAGQWTAITSTVTVWLMKTCLALVMRRSFAHWARLRSI
jgi:hypothetical protein